MSSNEAKNISIVPFLEHAGHQVAYKRGEQFFFKSPFRDECTASFNVNTARNIWYDFGSGEGGTIIDLVVKLNNCSVAQALDYLVPYKALPSVESVATSRGSLDRSANGLLQLRRVDTLQHPALLQYLRERRIPEHLGRRYLKEVHYQNTKYPKSGFFGLGLANESGGYELRNAYFQGSLGRKDITVVKGDNHRSLAVFEGAFDFLSYLADYGRTAPPSDTLVLNSVALVERCSNWINKHAYSSVKLFLDNDQAGDRAASHFAQQGYSITQQNHIYKGHKDYNAYWVAQPMSR